MYPQLLSWLSEKRLTIDKGRILNEQVLLEKPLQFGA